MLYNLQYYTKPATAQTTSKYHVITSGNAAESQEQCQQQYGTDLASIHNTEDMEEARSLCGSATENNACWNGLTRNRSSPISDTFYWLDGTEWDFGNFHLNTSEFGQYPWGNTNPNDNDNKESCLQMMSFKYDYLWADTPCDSIDVPSALCNVNTTPITTTEIPSSKPTSQSTLYSSPNPTKDPLFSIIPSASRLPTLGTIYSTTLNPTSDSTWSLPMVSPVHHTTDPTELAKNTIYTLPTQETDHTVDAKPIHFISQLFSNKTNVIILCVVLGILSVWTAFLICCSFYLYSKRKKAKKEASPFSQLTKIVSMSSVSKVNDSPVPEMQQSNIRQCTNCCNLREGTIYSGDNSFYCNECLMGMNAVKQHAEKKGASVTQMEGHDDIHKIEQCSDCGIIGLGRVYRDDGNFYCNLCLSNYEDDENSTDNESMFEDIEEQNQTQGMTTTSETTTGS